MIYWSFAGFDQWPFNYRTGLPKQLSQDDEGRSNKVHLPGPLLPLSNSSLSGFLQQKNPKQNNEEHLLCVSFSLLLTLQYASHRENDFFFSLSQFVFTVDWQKKNATAFPLVSFLFILFPVHISSTCMPLFTHLCFTEAEFPFKENSVLQVMYLVATFQP